MKLNNFLIFSFFFFVLISACNKVKKTDAEIERDNWIAGFADSIEYYQQQKMLIESQLQKINESIREELQNFELINNPREVTGYYLLKGWKNKIPYKSTGIYARINQNENLELIATLAGGTFNKICIGNFCSEIVPHDQAFNYRHEKYNTVYFTGGKADTIANYISDFANEKLTLEYVENAQQKNFIIPHDEKEMISKTWKLFSSQQKVHQLQKELWMDSRKIDAFRRMMDANKKTDN